MTGVRDPLVRSDISLLKNNETRKSANFVNGRFTDDHPSSRRVCQQVSSSGLGFNQQDRPTGSNERGSSSPHIELPCELVNSGLNNELCAMSHTV
jgi:hypothetical protein